MRGVKSRGYINSCLSVILANEVRPESYRFIIYYTILDDARTMMQGIPLYDPGRGQDNNAMNTLLIIQHL